MDAILRKIKENKIDYEDIKKNNVFIIQQPEEQFDISFLIPVRGRFNFAEPMYKSFKEAQENTDLKISYTVIEHSENPEHSKFCKENKLNYIWVKSKKVSKNPKQSLVHDEYEEELFNKCLCYNLGSLFGPKSKYILFHDIDIIFQKKFFNDLFDNIKNHENCKAIQCFTGRRVLMCNETITKDIVSGNVKADNLNLGNKDVQPSLPGAPGGSILVERELFFQVGGYDPELFVAYAPEDAMFWDKLSMFETVYISDNPNIEVFHMYHPPSYLNSPNFQERQMMYEKYKSLVEKDQKEFIKRKSELIKQYK